MRDQSRSLEAQLLRLAPRMRRFALVLTQGSLEIADAVVASAFDSAWRTGQRHVQQQPRLDFWLFREVVSIWRRDYAPLARGNASAANGSPSAVTARAAICGLPADERLIIGLMVIERMSADQAASVLNMSTQRANQIHGRARRNLDLALGVGRRAEGVA